MISAGAMNRRVRIERSEATRDPESNEEILVWVLVAEVFAFRRDTGAREFFSASAENTEQKALFTTWWREGITPAMRLVSQGQTFNITGVSEIGQRAQLQIEAKAVNEGPAE